LPADARWAGRWARGRRAISKRSWETPSKSSTTECAERHRRARLPWPPVPSAAVAERLERALPDDSSHEERPEPFHVQRRLLRLPHRLHDGRERKQIFSNKAHDEVVVVLVQAVAREADIVCQVRGAVRHPNGAVFGED